MSDKREKYLDFFGTKSKNFLGTGLTLEEFMQLHTAEKVQESWFRQERDERKRRLGFVMELSVELVKIKEQIMFCTALAESAIEAIIEGDWRMVKDWADHLSFEDERIEIHASSAHVYAKFRELLMQAYNTRPGTSQGEA